MSFEQSAGPRATAPRNRHDVAVCYIDRLPAELLCNTFELLSFRERVTASLVCKRWRTIALESSKLWQSICLCSTEAASALPQLLARSGRHIVHLDVTLPKSVRSLLTIQHEIVQHLFHISTLRLHDIPSEFVLSILRCASPSLESLFFRCRQHTVIDFPRDSFQSEPPMHLKHVRFELLNMILDDLSSGWFPNLVSWSYKDIQDLRVDDIRQLLGACPQLQSLSLHGDRVRVSDIGTVPPRLPSTLRHVTIGGFGSEFVYFWDLLSLDTIPHITLFSPMLSDSRSCISQLMSVNSVSLISDKISPLPFAPITAEFTDTRGFVRTFADLDLCHFSILFRGLPRNDITNIEFSHDLLPFVVQRSSESFPVLSTLTIRLDQSSSGNRILLYDLPQEPPKVMLCPSLRHLRLLSHRRPHGMRGLISDNELTDFIRRTVIADHPIHLLTLQDIVLERQQGESGTRELQCLVQCVSERGLNELAQCVDSIE